MKKSSRLRQNRFRTAENFAEANRTGGENHRVAPFDDPDVRGPSFLFDPTKLLRREPLGMQRATEHLKSQVSDTRSSETNTHDQVILSG